MAVPGCAGKWLKSRQPLEPFTWSVGCLTGGRGAAPLSMSSTASASHTPTSLTPGPVVNTRLRVVFMSNRLTGGQQELVLSGGGPVWSRDQGGGAGRGRRRGGEVDEAVTHRWRRWGGPGGRAALEGVFYC